MLRVCYYIEAGTAGDIYIVVVLGVGPPEIASTAEKASIFHYEMIVFPVISGNRKVPQTYIVHSVLFLKYVMFCLL